MTEDVVNMHLVINPTSLQKALDEGADLTIVRLNLIPLIIFILVLVFIYWLLKTYFDEFKKLITESKVTHDKLVNDLLKEHGIKKHE